MMSIEREPPVVVGLGPPAGGTAAVDLAAAGAAARGVPLVIVHCVDAAGDSARLAARRWLTATAGRVRAAHPGLVVSCDVGSGDPAAALVAHSGRAALVVVGHRGRAHAASVALRVAGGAGGPVIVCPPAATGTAGPGAPVLVGVTGDGTSEPAVAFAFAEADRVGAPLLAEHVWCRPADGVPARVDAHPVQDGRTAAEAERVLLDAVTPWSDKYPGVVVRTAVRHSMDAAVALTGGSRSARLVVVGSGRDRRHGGSVARALIRRAGCPVAVVGDPEVEVTPWPT